MSDKIRTRSAGKMSMKERTVSVDPAQGSLDSLVESVAAKLLPQLSAMIAGKLGLPHSTESPKVEVLTHKDSNIDGTSGENPPSVPVPPGSGAEEILPRGMKRPADHLSALGDESEPGEIQEEDLDCIVIPREVSGTWSVPEETASVVNTYFKSSLSKGDRRALFSQYPFPDLPGIKFPVLEETFLQTFKQRKINIRNIAGLAAVESVHKYLLHSIAPLLHIHAACIEAIEHDEALESKIVLEAVNAAVALLGNANSQAIFERRKMLLTALHPMLSGYANHATPQVESPALFGDGLMETIRKSIDLNSELNAFSRSLPKNEPPNKVWTKSPRTFQGASMVRGRMSARGSYGGRGRGGQQHQRFHKAPPTTDKRREDHREIACSVHRPSDITSPVHSISPSATTMPSTALDPSNQHCGLGHAIYFATRCQGPTSVVEDKFKSTTGFSNVSSRSRTSSRVRCFENGMGVPISESKYRRDMVTERFGPISPHQFSGTTCRLHWTEDFRKIMEELPSSTPYGQQVCSGLCKQIGGYTINKFEYLGHSNVGLVSSKRTVDHGRVRSWTGEYYSRLGVQELHRLERLETSAGLVSGPDDVPLKLHSGSICQSQQSPISHVLELEARSSSPGDRCPDSIMVTNDPLHFPSLLSRGSLCTEVYGREMHSVTRCTSLAAATVVSSTAGCSNQPPDSIASSGGSSHESSGRESSTHKERMPAACSMEDFSLQNRTEELLTLSLRSGTRKSYKSAWTCFTTWCQGQGVQPVSASLSHVLSYLTYRESVKKLAYNTINIHRSCLSYYLGPIEGKPVGENSSVIRLMKGIFNSNPPRKSIGPVWDVKILVDYLKSMGDNANLSLEKLSCKLICLLALTNADRCSDISSLDLRSLALKPEGAVFHHYHLKKTSRANFLPDSFYPVFSDDSDLCVVASLKNYISRTEKLRSSDRLIVSYVRPHKAVSPATISRWTQSVMLAAGIDTSQFKAHSARSASTTAAKSAGVSLSDIQRAADWTNPNTFMRHYYRPSVRHSSFATSVLGGRDH